MESGKVMTVSGKKCVGLLLLVLGLGAAPLLAQQAPAKDPAAQAAAQQQAQSKQVADGAVAAAKKKGLTILQAAPPQDVDGDGKLDVVAVVKDERDDLMVALFKAKAPNVVEHAWSSNGTGGTDVLSLQLKNMVGDKKPEVVVELKEQAPDEVRRQLRVYKVDEATPRQLLALSHEERGKEDVQLDRVSYGDDEPGYRVVDVDGDGTQEVSIRREPKVVKVKGKGDAVISLVIGVKELVYAWDGKQKGGGMYVLKQEKNLNFLPSLKLKKVLASSQKLPKDLELAEQDRALESSFNQAFDEKAVDAGPMNDEPAPVEANPAPRAYWATDNNFDSAWTENAKGDGAGEWLEVQLGEPKDIRMIRIVPTCGLDEKAVKNANEIQAFSLLFSGMGKVAVDRKEKVPSDSGVVAVLEVPSPERKFMPQVLVFLQKGTKSPWVRLQLDRVKKKSKGNEACIAEFSVH